MSTKEKNPTDTLYVGEWVVDVGGSKGIVVRVEIGTDNEHPGQVEVWQAYRRTNDANGNNCEYYREFGWRKSLKRVGPDPTFLYAVRDKSSGKFYKTHANSRSAGFVETFDDARTWTKRSLAKSKATSLGFGVELVEFVSFTVVVHDQTARLKKAAEKKIQDDLKKRAAHEVWALKQAKLDAERATERLHALENKLGRQQ